MDDRILTNEIFLTRQQVCARLNISKSHFYSEVDAPRLRITYSGGTRVHIEDLSDYIGRIRAGNYAPAYSETDPWVILYRSKCKPRKVAAAKRSPKRGKKPVSAKPAIAEDANSGGSL